MEKGDIISFGEFNWQVLHIRDNEVLIITEDIVELHWYHTAFTDITWADSDMRRYLNNDFLNNRFNQEEKVKITVTITKNPDNPWFKTRGGEDTTDSIFLLSLEEVCRYFDDSSVKLYNKDNQTWSINDQNNVKRQAKYNNDFHWWRLRSPGYYSRTSASVGNNGNVYVRGNGVYGRPRDGGGVRPALWMKLTD